MMLVTDSATSLAEAPGYVAVMVMAGGATSGYCATGILGIANNPASRMNRATTQAKIGRSIKNCGMWADSGSAHENRHAAPGAACRSGLLPRGRLLRLGAAGWLVARRRLVCWLAWLGSGLAGFPRLPGRRLYGRPRTDLLEALDH